MTVSEKEVKKKRKCDFGIIETNTKFNLGN